jgi:hypothetical protein
VEKDSKMYILQAAEDDIRAIYLSQPDIGRSGQSFQWSFEGGTGLRLDSKE